MKSGTDIPAMFPTNPIKTKATPKDGPCCTLPRYDGSLTVVASGAGAVSTWRAILFLQLKNHCPARALVEN
jgi:hypothetical protein